MYEIAEKFKSVQGEGCFAGTPMAFIRFVGCSVGKKVCHACDTDFDRTYPWLGGGRFSVQALIDWASPYEHVCLTGGEPFDQDLLDFVEAAAERGIRLHIETSGTKPISNFIRPRYDPEKKGPWICMSPKPGWLPANLDCVDEIKVIVPGLGNGEGWPGIDDAINWADQGHTVFLQPRNEKHVVNWDNLALVNELVKQYSSLRMSVQLHKLLKVR